MNLSRRGVLLGTAQAITTVSISAAVLTGCTYPWEEPGAPARDASGEDGDASSARVYESGVLHDFSVKLDDDEFTAMVETFIETEEKDWIHADVTIDGRTFLDAGMRLKGNSSLHLVKTDSDPAELPWLISLDKFAQGQSHEGYTDFVVRSSSTSTGLNEALALDLLAETGLASQKSIATSFSVNGGTPRLRLVVQSLDDLWDAENFRNEGILYKAESGGDYSYRGDDPASYTDIFDQETDKDEENLEPLIGFLKFLNESSDAEFREELDDHLEVQSFATYLAFEDLINNFDDIEGLGNNSYLRYDEKTGRMTIVAWDHNLAFAAPGFMGKSSPEKPARGDGPVGGDPVQGEPPEGGTASGPAYNVLASRFQSEPLFVRRYERAVTRLKKSLYDNGLAAKLLQARADLLTTKGGQLVDADTVATEAKTIQSYFAHDAP